MRLFILLVLFVLPSIGFSQAKYLVYFTDKANSKYSIAHPEAFLSPKSIARRQNQNIAIVAADLPVNQNYIDSLRTFDIKIWYKSRWFNAVYIDVIDTSLMHSSIAKLSFVRKIQLVKPDIDTTTYRARKSKKQSPTRYYLEEDAYGESYNQVSQLCADEMHKEGYRGEGMTIAVFDGGFTNANELYFFDSLFYQNRVKSTYNFVNNSKNVYNNSDHGTNVLSCMAGYAKGKLIGTAYKADFHLFITEDSDSEFPVEEANWLVAAEKADSLGVDIINSSLGYSTFDEARFNYSYADRNGRKSISAIAATFAARVGMICVVSAGNGGRSRFDPYIT